TERVVGELTPPLAEWPDGREPPYRPVESLRSEDQVFHSWQEAEERTIDLADLALGDLLGGPRRKTFGFPGRRWLEPLRGRGETVMGVLVREQKPVEGVVEAEAADVGGGLFKVTLRVANHTPLADAGRASRDDALLRSLVSTHTLLG